ncbi:MAG: NAD(P)-dependent oxidoreductase [Bacteroidota bacterium]
MKIGIIKEGKVPPDARVPLTPKQCRHIQTHFPVDILIQPSSNRTFADEAYEAEQLTLSDEMESCDVLMGVKEVPIEQLISNKTYFFFSHTIKKQAYNRDLLRAILDKNIRLIDYEVLTNEAGQRLIAFGRFAGMVGAHNALWTYGKRTGAFELKRMKDHLDYAEAKAYYQSVDFPALKIVLTGTGRVGQGAAQVLRDMGIRGVRPKDFLAQSYEEAVFTQLVCHDYAERKDRQAFRKQDFFDHPEWFQSKFAPYTYLSDIMINGIYWDNHAPAFFTKEEMKKEAFRIKVIADVTCDIAPVSSIPSTLRPSTIADPVFGYDPLQAAEVEAFQAHTIDMMTIDNLPNELPRDASTAFGQQFTKHILPALLKEKSEIIERATVAENGQLGTHFQYLSDYVAGK